MVWAGPIGGVEMIGLPTRTGGQDNEEGERVGERIEDWGGAFRLRPLERNFRSLAVRWKIQTPVKLFISDLNHTIKSNLKT